MAGDVDRAEAGRILVDAAHSCDPLAVLLIGLRCDVNPRVRQLAVRAKEQIDSGLEAVSLLAAELGWTIPEL